MLVSGAYDHTVKLKIIEAGFSTRLNDFMT
jgi:hypothetical protein